MLMHLEIPFETIFFYHVSRQQLVDFKTHMHSVSFFKLKNRCAGIDSKGEDSEKEKRKGSR